MHEPVSHKLIDPSIYDAVASDHQSRQALCQTVYDDGSVGETTHVFYWSGKRVQSCLLEEWEVVEAELLAQEQIDQTQQRDLTRLRQALRTRLQSSVGLRVDELQSTHLQALLAYLLYREGGLDKDLKVRPLSEWVESE